jgi:DNA repair protein RadD
VSDLQYAKERQAAARMGRGEWEATLIPRPYQAAAVECTWDFMRSREGNPAIVIPTAGGKSLVMALTARRAVEEWGGRVGIVAGSKELVRQNFEKMKAIWPQADCGIYSASLNRKDRFNRVLFLQVQSVAKRMHVLGRFDLLLFDEFHLVPTTGEGLYRTMIAGARQFNPDLRIAGYSATPYRLGVGPVCGPEHIFSEIAYEARIHDLIRDGYLCPLISRGGSARADLSGVKVRGGEYVEHDLAAAVDRSELVEAACDEMVAHAIDRHSWIVFAVSIEHAGHVADALNRRGVNAAVVHGGTPHAARDRLIAEFQAQRIRALVNVNVLTTGFDAPNIDCVVMLRPTKSAGLYVQMVGRGFRLDSSKSNTLVLDFSGNMLEFGPVDAIKMQRARGKSEAQVVTGKAKECPKCSAIIPMQARQCECGYQFGSPDPAHLDRPVDAPVLSTDQSRIVVRHAPIQRVGLH